MTGDGEIMQAIRDLELRVAALPRHGGCEIPTRASVPLLALAACARDLAGGKRLGTESP
jgi:hypothetical protein